MPAKRKPLERATTDKILDVLNMLPQTKFLKRHGSVMTEAGNPDIEGCVRGRSVQIEVKRNGEESSDLQKFRQSEWDAAGALVMRDVTSVEQVGQVLVSMLLVSWAEWDKAVENSKVSKRRAKKS